MNDIWPDDKILRLRELWQEGHSTAKIGEMLGISKNAVVGKAGRIGLSRGSPIKPAGSGQPAPPPRLPPPKLAAAVERIVTALMAPKPQQPAPLPTPAPAPPAAQAEPKPVSVAAAPVPAPKPAPAPAAPAPKEKQFTEAREEVLRREWPAGKPLSAIESLLSMLPGPAIRRDYIAIHASKLGLRRPPPPIAASPTPPPPAPKRIANDAASLEPVPVHFLAARDWAARNGIKYDGGNMDEVNKARARAGLAPFVQVAA